MSACYDDNHEVIEAPVKVQLGPPTTITLGEQVGTADEGDLSFRFVKPLHGGMTVYAERNGVHVGTATVTGNDLMQVLAMRLIEELKDGATT